MTDLEAATAAAATTWDLMRRFVFPGEGEFLKELGELTIEAESFRIEFRLQQDLLGPNSEEERTMVVLHTAPAGQPMQDSWSVRIRGHWPHRTDRFPRIGLLAGRKLRKAFSPKRRHPGPRYPNLPMNEDVYLMATTPADDLTAQLCLFVIQTELSANAELQSWLEVYLVRNFGFRVQDSQQREEAARDLTVRLIKYKWWPEDARAWRKYVKRVGRIVERPYRSHLATVPDHLAGPLDTENQLIERIEGNDEASNQESRRPSSRTPYDSTGARLTIQEVSQLAGIPLSTLYARIDRYRVRTEYDASGRMIVRRSELDHLMKTSKLSDVIVAVSRARGCSESTARRHVSRLRSRGLSLEDIHRQQGPHLELAD